MIKVIKEDFDGRILLINNLIHKDKRGYFFEGYKKADFDKNIKKINFVQDNYSFSKYKYTIRGLHFQKKPFGQKKLVTVLKGKIMDVVLDINPKSKYFGCHKIYILDSKNPYMLLINDDFAHGFCTLDNDTLVKYKVDKYYNKNKETTVFWNDKKLKINWPKIKSNFITSIKDSKAKYFENIKL